jgi:hypothetical protein
MVRIGVLLLVRVQVRHTKLHSLKNALKTQDVIIRLIGNKRYNKLFMLFVMLISSLLENVKTQTNKRKHPTQRPLSRILRFAAFAHPCASRKDAEAAERIYVMQEHLMTGHLSRAWPAPTTNLRSLRLRAFALDVRDL